VAFDYSRERAASRFTVLPVLAEAQARREVVRANLERVYRAAGIAWYVEWTGLTSAQPFAEVVRDRPVSFELRHATPGGSFRIFRVHLSGAASP
jgi:hypothetical protein